MLTHITYWENAALNRNKRRINRSHVNHEVIAEGLEEMREVQEKSAVTTKKARRDLQRRTDNMRNSLAKQRRKDAPATTSAVQESTSNALEQEDDDEVATPRPGAIPAKVQRGQ